ncbi:hypothetical protein [Paludisphaera rhizosphaerae]|uniref:hypothetical protein n=1 Tax=Paludisphaera rhizosphaerae TaxID=2711216 RepID=UPI0013EC350B|nr:hypothetical protein [Paludisphaera rhizosphaerae]
MSLDYPDYLRIRERSRRLGRLWMIGDRGYYLGLLGAVLALSTAIAAVIVAGLGGLVSPGDERALRWWRLLPGCIIAFPACVGFLFVSASLKAVAHRRSGIHDEGRDG